MSNYKIRIWQKDEKRITKNDKFCTLKIFDK